MFAGKRYLYNIYLPLPAQHTHTRFWLYNIYLPPPAQHTHTLLIVTLTFDFMIPKSTRSIQRAQTSLAEADHYSHIAHCKNVEPWLWKATHPPKKKKKKKKRFWIITCTTIWVCYHYYVVFFAHLLILQYPDHHQNLISSSLYYSGPVHKISSQSVHNFLSNVVHRQTNKQTNRQTNQRYQKHNLLCQGGNKGHPLVTSNISGIHQILRW